MPTIPPPLPTYSALTRLGNSGVGMDRGNFAAGLTFSIGNILSLLHKQPYDSQVRHHLSLNDMSKTRSQKQPVW